MAGVGEGGRRRCEAGASSSAVTSLADIAKCEEGSGYIAGKGHRDVGAGQNTLLVVHELLIIAPQVS